MMTLSEAALHLYIGLLFCVVTFSIVVILTVWSVHKKRRKAKQGDGGGVTIIPVCAACVLRKQNAAERSRPTEYIVGG